MKRHKQADTITKSMFP